MQLLCGHVRMNIASVNKETEGEDNLRGSKALNRFEIKYYELIKLSFIILLKLEWEFGLQMNPLDNEASFDF